MHRILRNRASCAGVVALFATVGLLVDVREAAAADINWKGYVWNVTDGGMAGVANGNSANVSVDADGYLHLKIQKNGNTWTAAELFTTTKLGFGTYQWQIDGPIDTLDKNVVLGLFPYGPQAGIGADGTNEIDIEYSRWGQANGPNGDWTDYPASGSTVGEFTYTFSLNGGKLSTSRFIWSKTSIEDFLLEGLQPLTSTAPLLKTWKYSPQNPTTNIPQQALPLGMNLWCYAIPSDGKNVEIVIRDFQFLAEGTSPTGGAGGSGGNSASGGTGNSAGSGGNSASGGSGNATGGRASSTGGRANSTGGRANSTGGVASGGGAGPNGGAVAIGGTGSNGGAAGVGGARSNGGALGIGGARSNGGALGVGGSRSNAGATSRGGSPQGVAGSSNGPQPLGGAVSTGGATSVIGTLSKGGATSTTASVALFGGAAPYGGSSTGGARSSAVATSQVESNDDSSSGCSIRPAQGTPTSRGLWWLGALSLLVGRQLRRRSSR